MSFNLSTVERCPVSRKTYGLIEIEPWIISELAGAVLDDDEWIIVLMGERKENGLHNIVTDLYVPSGQTRSKATCETKDDLPELIKSNLVGVLHSHNSMGAKFSGIDIGDGGLNRRFPMSIVISHKYSDNNEEACHLGFDYEAVTRFDLPCGSLGVAQCNIIPFGIEDWPHHHFIERGWNPDAPLKIEEQYEDIGDCDNYGASKDSTKYYLTSRIARCGITATKTVIRGYSFGANGNMILNRLPKPEYSRWKGGKNKYRSQKEEDSLYTYYGQYGDYQDDPYGRR